MKPKHVRQIDRCNIRRAYELGFEEHLADLGTQLPDDLLHSRRVGVLAHRIVGMATKEPSLASRAGVAGLLHDIGKANEAVAELIRIDGPLSEVQRQTVGTHTVIGSLMADQVNAQKGRIQKESQVFDAIYWSAQLHHQSLGLLLTPGSEDEFLLIPRAIAVSDICEARYAPERERFTGVIRLPEDDVVSGQLNLDVFLCREKPNEIDYAYRNRILGSTLGGITVAEAFKIAHHDWPRVAETLTPALATR